MSRLRRTRRDWTRWIHGALRVLLAGMFVLAGYGKLSGAPDAVAVFDAVGLGDGLRYLTGGIEIVAAALLVTRRWAAPAAVALSGVMLGAIAAHLGPVGGSPAVPAALLVLLLASLAMQGSPAAGLPVASGARTERFASLDGHR